MLPHRALAAAFAALLAGSAAPTSTASAQSVLPPDTEARETVAKKVLTDANLKIGDVVRTTIAEKIDGIVSEGISWLARNGTTFEIVEYRPIATPKVFAEATEKYSAQVTLGPERTLENWVAGLPFPNIDLNDPEAGTKVMHNFQRTHYFTESLDLNLMDADTGAMYRDAKGRAKYNVERHFIPEWLRLLKFQGRLFNDPRPKIEPNADEVFYKAGLYPLIEPFDLKGVGGVSFRYLDQKKHDDTWLYLPLLRRVRRISSTQRSDALFGQDVDIDSFGGYAGQIPWFTWKLLGRKAMLASLHGERLPPEPCEGDGGMTFCEPWEPRPGLYIVEGSSIFPGYAFSKRVIYVDDEGWIIPYSDMYDWAGELWKNVHISFRVDKKPNPKVDFSYPEERMFAYAFTVVDMQLRHSTRVAIPGLAFQHEPGWYLDLGMDAPTSVDEAWFSVGQLIAGGR